MSATRPQQESSLPEFSSFVTANQVLGLGFTAVLGISIAYYNASWWTLLGATLGVILTGGLYGLCHLIMSHARWLNNLLLAISRLNIARKIARRLFHWCKRFARFLCLVFLGDKEGREGYRTFRRINQLAIRLWQMLYRASPKLAQRLLFVGLVKSPAYYARWVVVGLMMREIFAGMLLNSESTTAGGLEEDFSITPMLDLTLGLLVALSSFREMLQDMGRHALDEAQEVLKGKVAEETHSLSTISGLDARQSLLEVSRLREAVRRREFQLGSFCYNTWKVAENLLNLLVVSLVLFLISLPGAVLAAVAICSIVPSMLWELVSLQQGEKASRLDQMKRRALQEFASDPRAEKVIRSLAPKGAIVGTMRRLSASILERVSHGKTKRMVQRVSARVVFFTLFALSTLFPVLAACQGELQPRVALLYIFSMLGLWYALSAIAETTSVLWAKFDDLSEVEEALSVISGQGGHSPPVLPEPASSQVCLSKLSFNYPFKPQLLRFAGEYQVPGTVCLAETIKIIGRPRSGKSTLLRLLIGELKPSSGEILLGETKAEEVYLGERVKYIPEALPNFSRVVILELFEAYLDTHFEEGSQERVDFITSIEQTLRRFGLLEQIRDEDRPEYTGVNLLINWRDNYLTEEQTRLLFFSLQYQALLVKLKDPGFEPKILAVDGIHRLTSRALRKRCFEAFTHLANEFHATLITVALHDGDLEDSDHVFAILEPEDISPGAQRAEQSGNLLAPGQHLLRKNHSDKLRRGRYKAYLAELRNCL